MIALSILLRKDHGLPPLGIKHDQTEVDLSYKLKSATDVSLVASYLKDNRVITNLNLRVNDLRPEGGEAIAEALKVNAVLTARLAASALPASTSRKFVAKLRSVRTALTFNISAIAIPSSGPM